MTTDAEKVVLLLLADAWNAYLVLPFMHPSERGEFAAAIHAAQNLIAWRVAVRSDPVTWGDWPRSPCQDALAFAKEPPDSRPRSTAVKQPPSGGPAMAAKTKTKTAKAETPKATRAATPKAKPAAAKSSPAKKSK